jgi:3-deoxy-D-manno-octulosonic-acid transferase
MFHVYNGFVLLALPLIALWVLLRWRRRVFKKGLHRWSERCGILPPEFQNRLQKGERWWWVHAVSVGEVKAIEKFLQRAPEHAHVHVLLSAVTPEALIWATERRLADQVIAAPIDLPWFVRRVFRSVKPELFISVESEFWPNLLGEAKRSGARVALINGRLSQRSFESYQKITGVMQALWDCFDLWAVREAQDAERFQALGVPSDRLRVTGNLKYDLLVEDDPPPPEVAPHSPVIVIGSSREGEELLLVPVLLNLRGEWPDLRVIWAPRHVERVSEVERMLLSKGLVVQRKSRPGGPGEANDILWDTMGDLLDAYRQADIAIVGGSFVPRGGQNPIEPAALRRPVVFGPSMENFHGIAERLVNHGGARQVSLEKLGACLSELLSRPQGRQKMGECARQVVERHQGATEKTLQLLEGLQRG